MTIGQNISEQAVAKIFGVNAALVGDATHDTVANFTGGTVELTGPNAAAYYLVSSDNVLGTRIEILQPGKYLVTLQFTHAGLGGGGSVVKAGITYDADLAQQGNDPEAGNVAVVGGGQTSFCVADNQAIQMSALVDVTQNEANTAGIGVVRAQWSNNADGAPTTASIIEAMVRVARVAELDA